MFFKKQSKSKFFIKTPNLSWTILRKYKKNVQNQKVNQREIAKKVNNYVAPMIVLEKK